MDSAIRTLPKKVVWPAVGEERGLLLSTGSDSLMFILLFYAISPYQIYKEFVHVPGHGRRSEVGWVLGGMAWLYLIPSSNGPVKRHDKVVGRGTMGFICRGAALAQSRVRIV